MRIILGLIVVSLLFVETSFTQDINPFNGAGIGEVSVNFPDAISSGIHRLGQVLSGRLRRAAVNEFGHVVALDGALVEVVVVSAINQWGKDRESRLVLQVTKITTRWGEMAEVETKPVVITTKRQPATTLGRDPIQFKIRKARN